MENAGRGRYTQFVKGNSSKRKQEEAGGDRKSLKKERKDNELDVE